jgi:hypothetical protein
VNTSFGTPLTLSMQDLPVEAQLVHALSAVRWSAAIQQAAHETIANNTVDWLTVMDQALRLRVMALIGRNVTRYRAWVDDDGVPVMPNSWIYATAYDANRHRNQRLFDEAASLFCALNRDGIRYAIRKGPALCARVYDDAGIRPMSDVDILIEPDQLDEVSAILTDHGYAQGTIAANGRTVTPFQRETRVFWSMHLTNALPFLKPSSDPHVGSYAIDLCLNLLQKRSAGSIDTASVLKRATRARICGEDAYALHPVDNMLDLCLHLYKEATSYLSIQRGRDLSLMRFIDVAESARLMTVDERAALVDASHSAGTLNEIYYALYHTAILYPSAIDDSILSQLKPEDVTYLDQYGSLEGRVQRWRRPFLQRLFDPKRSSELDGASTIPSG